MMTKKHFNRIAETIRTAHETRKGRAGNDVERHTACCIAVRLAGFFKAENPNFDHDRFMTACGFGDGNT